MLAPTITVDNLDRSRTRFLMLVLKLILTFGVNGAIDINVFLLTIHANINVRVNVDVPFEYTFTQCKDLINRLKDFILVQGSIMHICNVLYHLQLQFCYRFLLILHGRQMP